MKDKYTQTQKSPRAYGLTFFSEKTEKTEKTKVTFVDVRAKVAPSTQLF